MRNAVSETLLLAQPHLRAAYAGIGIAAPARGHMRCPLGTHPDKHPSFRVDWRTGKWHCTCGTGDLLDAIIARGYAPDFVEAAKVVCNTIGLPPIGERRQETPAERRAREARVAEARQRAEENQRRRETEDAEDAARMLKWIRDALWGWSYPARGTVVERYLRSRGIKVLPNIISYLPSHGPEKLAAMLTPFGVASEPEPGLYEIELDAIVGAHITLLTPDGRKAVDSQGRTKIMLGRGHDTPLMLVPPNDSLGLIIGEGIEDALSFHQETGLGAWAAGSAGRLSGLAQHVPDYIESVTVIEDDNDAGRAGCKGLGEALYQRGIDVLYERGRVLDGAA